MKSKKTNKKEYENLLVKFSGFHTSFRDSSQETSPCMSFNESTENSTDSLEKEATSALLDSCPRGLGKIKPTNPWR